LLWNLDVYSEGSIIKQVNLYYTWTPCWVSGKLIPGKDVVFLQVTYMANGQNKEKDIKRHVQSWLKKNSAKVDAWIKEAKAAK
jgi:ABC-type proline/glycine betaine transport system substrate-binding protein